MDKATTTPSMCLARWRAREAARLYEEAAKSFLGKKMVEETAGAYKKLGYACARAAGTAENAEEHVERNKCAVEAYKETEKLFGQTGNRSEELECEAEALYASRSVADSVMEAKKAFSKSYELFIESSELCSNQDDQECLATTLSRGAMASYFLVTYCSDARANLQRHRPLQTAFRTQKWEKEQGKERPFIQSTR